jgi:hypothetical protein
VSTAEKVFSFRICLKPELVRGAELFLFSLADRAFPLFGQGLEGDTRGYPSLIAVVRVIDVTAFSAYHSGKHRVLLIIITKKHKQIKCIPSTSQVKVTIHATQGAIHLSVEARRKHLPARIRIQAG